MSIGKWSIPLNVGKGGRAVIAHAESEPVAAAADDVHSQVAQLQHGRILGPIVRQRPVCGVASVDPNLRRHILEPRRISLHQDRPGVGRHALS